MKYWLTALLFIVSLVTIKALEQNVCYDDLGCFSTGGVFFDPINRPINLLPQNPSQINTRFLLFTRNNRAQAYEIPRDNGKAFINGTGPYSLTLPTKFLIHGFIDNMEVTTDWMQKMKDQLLIHGDYNVILVDWSQGNRPPYTQAAANARVVGAEIALLIKALTKESNVSLSSIHLIGHSLGAHVAGYAGEIFNGSLGRITGLAPAGPAFDNMPLTVRLDRSDAAFVDAIHSDARSKLSLGFGIIEATGHVDFYPNGGARQPACTLSRKHTDLHFDDLIKGVRNFALCDHQQAVDFFTNSINNKNCMSVGWACNSYSEFLEGICADLGVPLGLHADDYKSSKKFDKDRTLNVYLQQSGDEHNYCVHQYQVIVEILKHKHSKSLTGSLAISLHGNFSVATLNTHYSTFTFTPGHTYKFFGSTEANSGSNVSKLHVKWSHRSSISDIFQDVKLHVKKITIIPMSIADKRQRDEATATFCALDANHGLQTIYPETFKKC